eukprot:Skav202442  [mRNA]  locus=scaffold2841:31012:31381:- [translate_table: standard]
MTAKPLQLYAKRNFFAFLLLLQGPCRFEATRSYCVEMLKGKVHPAIPRKGIGATNRHSPFCIAAVQLEHEKLNYLQLFPVSLQPF